jgi:NIMA (never in mitosis gene a)-related kinase
MSTTPAARQAAEYKPLGVLGQGTYGTCYKVRRVRDGQVAVMKVISLAGLTSKDVDDSCKEAILLKKLQHPHIVRYHDAWVDTSQLCIVMEYCGGGDLASANAEGRELSEPALWRYIMHVASGLEFLHRNRILHRYVSLLSPVTSRRCKRAELLPS